MSFDTISQIGISTFGLVGIFLVAKKNKWGFVIGLISQPFWITTALINNQWGVLLTSIIYTFIWIFGIHEWFFKNKKAK